MLCAGVCAVLVRARCTAVGAPEAAPCVRRRGRPLTRQDAAYSFVTTARPPADLSLSAVSAMLALSSTMLTVCTPCAARAETDVSRQAQRWRRVASSRPRGGTLGRARCGGAYVAAVCASARCAAGSCSAAPLHHSAPMCRHSYSGRRPCRGGRASGQPRGPAAKLRAACGRGC